MKAKLDSMLADFIKSEPMEKTAVPPMLARKMRYWLDRIKSSRIVHQSPTQKSEDLQLAKNEACASVYDSGLLKLDFGADVPEPVRKAAMSWAKRRGLKVLESPLTKSADKSQTYIFGVTEDARAEGAIVKRQRWSF